jgi:hypothetical protein
MVTMQETARKRQPPLELLGRALGPPSGLPGKARRLAAIIAGYGRGGELERRLARLSSIGIVDVNPTRVQMAVGAIDMLRFWISPAAADYYEQQQIDYSFHQVLRFLDEPASLVDPVGFFSTRDGIIGHLMQVVHANPVYDFQLLSIFEDGLDELEKQLKQMLVGNHPRAESIGAIVEEPDYHERLLEFLQRWRADPTIPPLLRSNVGTDSRFTPIERTFGSLTGAMRYFSRMPSSPREGVRHLLSVHTFPVELAEPAPS